MRNLRWDLLVAYLAGVAGMAVAFFLVWQKMIERNAEGTDGL